MIDRDEDPADPERPSPEPPGRRPFGATIGPVLVVLGSLVQLTLVASLLLVGVDPTVIVRLAVIGGLATIGIVAAVRAWAGLDWGVAVGVAALELILVPWLWGFDALGLALIVGYSAALIGLARARPWFQAADDPAG